MYRPRLQRCSAGFQPGDHFKGIGKYDFPNIFFSWRTIVSGALVKAGYFFPLTTAKTLTCFSGSFWSLVFSKLSTSKKPRTQKYCFSIPLEWQVDPIATVMRLASYLRLKCPVSGSYLPGSLIARRPRDCVQPTLEIGQWTGGWPCIRLLVDVAIHLDRFPVPVLNRLTDGREDTD